MAKRIGEVLSGVLQEAQRRHGNLRDIQQAWPTLVGRDLAAHTKPTSLRRGRLVVSVDRPWDGFALNYPRTHVLTHLRRITGGLVEELLIRPGDTASA